MNNKNQIENLYRKNSKESSPLDLDNLILNQAKQSCKKTNQSKTLKRWLYALPTAAVLMISFTVVINLQNQNQDFSVSPNYSSIDEGHKKNLRPTIAPPLEPHAAPKKTETRRKRLIENKDSNHAQDLGEIISENKTFDYGNSAAIIEQEKPAALVGKMEPIRSIERAKKKQTPETTFEEQELHLQDSAAPLDTGIIATQSTETDDKALERIVVTGSRIQTTDLKTSLDIQKLEDLIINKRFAKAKRLLKELKEKYPDFDFSELEKLID